MPPEGHTTITLPDELVAQIDRRTDSDTSRADALRSLMAADAEAVGEPFNERYLVEPELLEAAVRTYGGEAVVSGFVDWGEWLVDAVESDGRAGPVTLEPTEYDKIAEEVASELEGRMK
jgi:hypothetical protein